MCFNLWFNLNFFLVIIKKERKRKKCDLSCPCFLFFLLTYFPILLCIKIAQPEKKNLWTFNILCKIRQIFKTWTRLLGQCQLVLIHFYHTDRCRFFIFEWTELAAWRWSRLPHSYLMSAAAARIVQNARITFFFLLCIICDLNCVIVFGFFHERMSPASLSNIKTPV